MDDKNTETSVQSQWNVKSFTLTQSAYYWSWMIKAIFEVVLKMSNDFNNFRITSEHAISFIEESLHIALSTVFKFNFGRYLDKNISIVLVGGVSVIRWKVSESFYK